MLLPRLPGSSLWSSSGQKRITTIVANDAPVRFGKGLTTQQLFCWNASKTMSVVDLQNTAMRWGDNSYKLPKHSGNSAPGPRGDRSDGLDGMVSGSPDLGRAEGASRV